MNTAEQLSRVLSLVVGDPARLQVRDWDGTVAGPAGAPLFDALVARVGGLGRAPLYMAGSALPFGAGRIGVNQVLAVRRGGDGASGLPPTRDGWYGWFSAR